MTPVAWLAGAALAQDPGLVLHRWRFADGTDDQGGASLAAASGIWYLEGRRAYAKSKVTDIGGVPYGGVVSTDLVPPVQWTIDLWFALDIDRPEAADGQPAPDVAVASIHLAEAREARRASEPTPDPVLDLEISIRCAPGSEDGTILLHGDRVELASLPAPGVCVHQPGTQDRKEIDWHIVRLGWDGAQLALGLDRVAATPVDAALPESVRMGLRAGIGSSSHADLVEGEEVWLDEMLVRAEAPASAPWDRPLEPAAFGPLPYREPFGAPSFDLGGHYLGLVGWLDGRITARHRLVAAAEAQLTRHTQAVLQVRTLETRALAATGSMLGLPQSARLTSASDVGLSVEQAWITRNSTHARSPFFLGAGRLATSFGAGLLEQNALGAIDPPAWSPAAVFGHVVADDPTVRADALSDRTFPSTIDGLALGARFRQREDERSEWLLFRLGRRNPRCLGRRIDVPGSDDATADAEPSCPELMRSIYELGTTLSASSPRLFGERREALSAGALGAGIRWLSNADRPHVVYTQASVLATTARTGRWWFRLAVDGVAEAPVWRKEERILWLTTPELQPPVEERGTALGAALQGDLSGVGAPWFVFSIAGGGDASNLAWPGAGRGFHPDMDVDLVGFEQVVAGATARGFAAGAPGVLPSYGGVFGGFYARFTPTLRWADVGETMLSVIPEYNTLTVPGELEPGWLGVEFDWALRVRVAGWRLACAVGSLTPLDAVETADPTRTSVSFRLARNL